MNINSIIIKKLTNIENIKFYGMNVYYGKSSKLSNINTTIDQKYLKINPSSNKMNFFIGGVGRENPLSIAELNSSNIFRISPMRIFAYLFGKGNTMTINPNNIKGGIMQFKTNVLMASTIVALSVLSLPTLAESADAQSPVNTSWQPYVGGSAGYSRMSAKNKWSEDISTTHTIGKSNFNSKGFIGLLHVGIQKAISSKVKLGGELYGFLESHKASTETGVRAESLKRENGGGIKLKAGYLFDTNSSFYAHVGAEKAGFKYTVDLGGGISTTFKKYLWGMPFGVGIEAVVSPSWIARLEYTHTIYQKWDTGLKAVGVDSARAKIASSQDSILLGLSYKI